MAADGTSFLIDIATKLTGGDASVATLSALGDKMLAAGATAGDLASAIDTTSAALTGSADAMKLASDAVEAGAASYRSAEIAADRAAKNVEKLGVMADAQRGKLQAAMDAGDGKGAEKAAAKLAALTARQGEAQAKALSATAAMQAEAAALDKLHASAGAAAADHRTLAAGLANVKAAAEKVAKADAAAAGSGKVNETAEALGKLGGPLGTAGAKAFGLADGFKKLVGSLGSTAPYVAVAVALVAVATALITATVAVVKWAVGLADARRTQSLLAAGIAQSVEGGIELDATISRLGATVPQTREELLAMAGDLAKTGLKGAALSSALEEAAVKAARLKWGPDFAKQMLSLDSQAKRLQTNLAGTFGGLKIEGLLGGFAKLVALFDSSTEAGEGLRVIFEGLFQPIVNGVTAALPMIERMFLQAEILALRAYIAMKPYSDEIAALGKVFGFAAVVIGVTLAGAIGAAVVSLAGMAAIIAVPIAAIGALVSAVISLGSAVSDVLGPVVAKVADFGSKMIAGLVEGLTAGASSVVQAITGVVGGAIDAAKHLLGIASPSKVFAGIGDFTAQGFAEGVEGGTADAQGSLAAMVAPPAEAGAGGTGGAQFGAVSVTINVEGGGTGDDIAGKIRAALTDFFTGAALQVGGGETAHA